MIDLHVDVHGDGKPPYLLLVHGMLSSRAQWRPNVGPLGEVCTPVTVELLGHGRSPSPSDPDAYTVSTYLRRFEALREALGSEQWFVCGQSFGAGLTIRYALEHPDRVIGQIFTNSNSGLASGPRGSPEAREAHARDIVLRGHEALKDMHIYPRPSRRLAKDLWEDMLADAELLSPFAIAQTTRFTTPDLAVGAELSRISVPTLLVNGVRETPFQPFRDRAAREIPGIVIVDLPGGHSVNLDPVDGFNAAVADFIRQHRGRDFVDSVG